jgi:hypothetical protein
MSRRWVVALAVVALLVASPVEAQYFGKNKVQYDEFDFQVMKTPHLDIYYYPSERMAVEEVARMAERWIARLTAVLDHQLRGRQPLILYAQPCALRSNGHRPRPDR